MIARSARRARRSRGAAGAITAVLAAVALGACGGDPARENVEAYLRDANAVQQRWAPEFQRVNEAYLAYSRGDLEGDAAARALTRAEASMQRARGDVAALRPPADARPLHDGLVRYFDLNIDMAGESALLARYLPAAEAELGPLPKLNRRLARDLGKAGDARGETRALRTYAGALEDLLDGMAGLAPPPVLAASHRTQVRRLSSVRRLAVRLERALADQDARRVAVLLRRFRRLNEGGASGTGISRRAVRAYGARYQAIVRAGADLRRAQIRLARRYEP